MVKVEKESDLILLSNTNKLIAKYLENYMHYLFRQYDCLDISEFGTIFLLENESDSKKHEEMGLSLPLEKAIFEFTDLLTLTNEQERITVLHSCFVLTNDYAISVFAQPKRLSKPILANLLNDCTERTINVNNERMI